MKKTLLLLLVTMVAGCFRQNDLAQADNRILFDRNGCAYYVEPGVGDTSFVRRMRDSDQQGCDLP